MITEKFPMSRNLERVLKIKIPLSIMGYMQKVLKAEKNSLKSFSSFKMSLWIFQELSGNKNFYKWHSKNWKD